MSSASLYLSFSVWSAAVVMLASVGYQVWRTVERRSPQNSDRLQTEVLVSEVNYKANNRSKGQ